MVEPKVTGSRRCCEGCRAGRSARRRGALADARCVRLEPLEVVGGDRAGQRGQPRARWRGGAELARRLAARRRAARSDGPRPAVAHGRTRLTDGLPRDAPAPWAAHGGTARPVTRAVWTRCATPAVPLRATARPAWPADVGGVADVDHVPRLGRVGDPQRDPQPGVGPDVRADHPGRAAGSPAPGARRANGPAGRCRPARRRSRAAPRPASRTRRRPAPAAAGPAARRPGRACVASR